MRSEHLTPKSSAREFYSPLTNSHRCFVGLFRVFGQALDRRVTLSVRFVNGACAKPGSAVSKELAKWKTLPSIDGLGTIDIPEGLPLPDGSMIVFTSKVVQINGVWDLPLIGAETGDVEHKYQLLTDGPPITTTCLHGAIVRAGDIWCQLQERFESREAAPKPWSAAAPKPGAPAAASDDGATPPKPGLVDPKHFWSDLAMQFPELATTALKDTGAAAAHANNFYHETNFYPASVLPEDAVFVLRTAELARFEAELSKADDVERKAGLHLPPRSEATYLTIIGALLELVRNPRPGRDSDAAVIRELTQNYGDKPGIAKSTLEGKFANARRQLQDP